MADPTPDDPNKPAPAVKPTVTIAEHAEFRNIPEDKLVKMIALQNQAQITAIDPVTPPEQWVRANQNSELVQKALDKLYPTSKIAGYGNGKAMISAIDAAKTSGQKFIFITIDGNNFGGMAKQVNSQEQARIHEKAMVDITRNALAKRGLEVKAFRPTPELVGDEYGLVTKGDPEKVAAALEEAKAEVAKYAKANGLTDLPYRKEGGPATKSVGLAFGTEEITPDKTAPQIVENAESKLKISKTEEKSGIVVKDDPSLKPQTRPQTGNTPPVEPVRTGTPTEPVPTGKPVTTGSMPTEPAIVPRIPELRAGQALGGVSVLGGTQQLIQANGDPYKTAEGTTKILSGGGMVFKPRAAGPLFIVASIVETGIAATEGYEKGGTEGALKKGGHKVAEIGSSIIMYTPETFVHIKDWGGNVIQGDWNAAKKSSDDMLFSTLPGTLGQVLGNGYAAIRDLNKAEDDGRRLETRSLSDEGKDPFNVRYDDVGGYTIGISGGAAGPAVMKLKELGVIPKTMTNYKDIETIVSRQLTDPSPAIRNPGGGRGAQGIAPEYREMIVAASKDLRMIYATDKQAKETGSLIRYLNKENTRDEIKSLREYLDGTPPDKIDKAKLNTMLAQVNERMKQYGYADYALKGDTFTEEKPAVDPALSPAEFKNKAETRLIVMNAALTPERKDEFIPSKPMTEVKEKFEALRKARGDFAELPEMFEKAVKQVPVNGAISVSMKDVAERVEKMNASLVKAGKEPMKLSFDIRSLPVGDPKAFASDPRFAELQTALDKVAKDSFRYGGVTPITYNEQDEIGLKAARGPAQDAVKAEMAALAR